MVARISVHLLLVTVFSLSAFRPAAAETCTRTDQVVQIGDAGLRSAIMEELAKPKDASLTCGDMAGLTKLNARARMITSLSGLEHATEIARLDLGDNQLRDLSPLKALAKITTLQLDRNFIADLTPLLRNTHITNGVSVDVSRNCLDTATTDSPDLTAIHTLEARRVALDAGQQKGAAACANPGALDPLVAVGGGGLRAPDSSAPPHP